MWHGNKEHAGYPKFKNKHDNHKSYTTNFTNGNITVDFEGNRVKLLKLKDVKAKLHRNFSGQIKSATISQVPSGKYYGRSRPAALSRQNIYQVLIVDANPKSDISAGFRYRDCDDSK